MLWFWLIAAHADCSDGVGSAELRSRADAVRDGFAARDLDGLREAAERARDAVPCLIEIAGPQDVALLMRMQGLARFIIKDRAGAAELFAAARQIEPAFRFDDAFIGPSHPARVMFEAVPLDPGERAALDRPATGEIYVDGYRADDAPVDRPYLFQRVGTGGTVLQSQLVPSGGRPEYAVAELEVASSSSSSVQPSLGVSVGALLAPNPSAADVFVGLGLSVGVPVTDRVEARGEALVARDFGAPATLPLVRVGARYWLGTGTARPFVGVDALGVLHGGRDGDRSDVRPMSIGLDFAGGLNLALAARVGLEFELVGWVGTGHVPDVPVQVALLPRLGTGFVF